MNMSLNFKIVGGSPTASYFILHTQNKVTKQKGAPCHGLRLPCVAQLTWRLRNSPSENTSGSDSPRRNPHASLRYSAWQQGMLYLRRFAQ